MANSIRSHDNIRELAAAWPAIKEAAAKAGATAAHRAALEVYETERRWSGNRPSTILRKGHSKVMLGTHEMLRGGLRLDKWRTTPLETSWTLGWDDTPRPDSSLTLAQLAEVMEGLRPQPPSWDKKDPPYPWLSQVAYGKGRARVRVAMRGSLHAGVTAVASKGAIRR